MYGLNSNSLQFGQGGLGLQMPNFAPQYDFGGMGAGGSGTAPVQTPSAAAGFQLGFNAPTLQMGLSGLNTVGNLYGAWQANKLARDQLDFTKSVTNTNLNNSIQSYNTALADRARARGFTEGQSDSQVQDYVSANSLRR